MSRDLGTQEAPAAARAARPGWRDPRLWVGLAIVAGSVLVGVRLVDGADETITVWVAEHDLDAGSQVGEGDLVARKVRFDADADPDLYLRAENGMPDVTTLQRPVGAGELVPAAAFGRPPEGLLEVPLWAQPQAVPSTLRVGSRVDVWVTATEGDARPSTQPVLRDVLVLDLAGSKSASGPTGHRQVLVGVPDEQTDKVGAALAAAAGDRLAFTREG